MKVLLLHPKLTCMVPADYGRPALYEPIGLGYLAAVLRQKGHQPVVIDCFAEGWQVREPADAYTTIGLSDASIRERLLALSPGVVGITFQFTGFDRDARHLAHLVRETLPGVPILIGGADATARHEEFILDPCVDMVVRGEGEQTFVEVLDRIEAEGRLPEELNGTTLKGRVNPPREEIEDIDTIPFPARDLLPMDIYLEDQEPLFPYSKRKPVGFMVSSRGCPYNCIFCSTTKVWRRWRPRSPKNVVDEIEHLIQTYGVREIAFQDDSFFVDPERVRLICEEMIRRRLDITWSVPPGVAANRMTEDLIPILLRSGFYRACFPIESGDPEILEWIRKPIDFEEALEAIERCHRHGIWTYGNFIIGFPEQTADSIEKTAQFAESCGLDMVNVYVAQPYAGSELYDQFRELGLYTEEKATASTVFYTLYDTVHFTAAELRAKRDEIYARFMKRRIRRLFTLRGMLDMWRKLNTPSKALYGLHVARVLLGNSLHTGKIALFGSVARKTDHIKQHGDGSA